MKKVLSLCVAAMTALGAAGVAQAAEPYPTRPVTLLVPFAAGGPTDAIARQIAQHLSGTLGQQVIAESIAGAGGTVGAARAARAQPDGYTLLIHHVALPAAASLYPKLAYDTATAFEPIGLINSGPMVVMSKKDYPAADATALIAKLKEDGPKTSLAHAGVGSNAHLCGLLMQKALGVKFTQAAYKGTGPAMTDLMGGQVDILCDQSTNAVPQVEGGTVRGFAVTSKDRLPVLKDLPTLQEAGLSDFDFTIWHGLYAPAGTPAEIIAKLNDGLRKAAADPAIQEAFAKVGTSVFPAAEMTPERHREMYDREMATWKSVIGDGLNK